MPSVKQFLGSHLKTPARLLTCAALMGAFVIDNPHCGQVEIDRVQLATTYLEAGHYERALREIRRARRQRGSDETLLLLAALAHMGKNDEERALAALFEALALAPDDATLHETLRDFCRQADLYAPARRGLIALRQQHPQSAALLTSLGWVLAHLGEDEGALARLDSALALDPRQLLARLERSRIFMEAERFAEAEEELRAALLLAPEDSRLLVSLGDCLLGQGRVQAADSTFQRALEKRGSTAALAARVAQLYYQRDLRHKSIEYYERALARDPDNAFVLNNLAWTYAEVGVNLERATALSLRSLKIAGENPVYLDTFAELLYLRGQHRRAFAAIRRALELEPEGGAQRDYLQRQYDKMERALAARL